MFKDAYVHDAVVERDILDNGCFSGDAHVHYLSRENTFTPSYQILSMPPTLMLALERIRMTRNVVVGGLKS